jgi:predicted SAM-dependent methyltransferase
MVSGCYQVAHVLKGLLKSALARLLKIAPLRNVLINALARGGWVSGVRMSPLPSETSFHRKMLGAYCQGSGVDLGFGGDPINETAVRVDLPQPYSTGIYHTQLAGDANHLSWFADGALDYVFSSHLLEDFPDTEAVLKEWLRVLKPGGKLVIGCPDEVRYRSFCTSTGHPINEHHVHEDFSLAKVKLHLAAIGGTSIAHECDAVGPYSWEIVAQKNESI